LALSEESDRQPVFNIPGVVVTLALVMVGVHLLRSVLSPQVDLWILELFAFVPDRFAAGGTDSAYLGGFPAEIWSFVTYAFLHADAMHLIVNTPMFAAFGAVVARRFGTIRFLVFAVLTAAGAAAAHMWSHLDDVQPVIGASGIVSGLMGAVVRFGFVRGGPMSAPDPRDERAGDVNRSATVPAATFRQLLTEPRAIFFVLAFFLMNLLLVFGAEAFAGPGASIAWEAHIGGFLTGLLVFSLFDPVGTEAPREHPE
jgi:membrane associated rhomboid family serine protease